jgi:hypothetical protein
MSFEDWKASKAAPAAPAANDPTKAVAAAPMSFEEWKTKKAALTQAAAKPAEASASKMPQESKPPAADAPAEKKESWAKKFVWGTLENAGTVTDTVVGFPMALGMDLAGIVMTNIALHKGEDPKTAWKAGEMFKEDLDNPLAHPIASIMQATGHKEGYTNSTVAKVLNGISGYLQKGAGYVAEKTGIPEEAANALINQLTNLGLMRGGRLITDKVGLTKPEAKPEAPPKPSDISFAGPALDAEGKPTQTPKMGEGMEDLQERRGQAKPSATTPAGLPVPPTDKQNPSALETTPPAEETKSVGAEGPSPERKDLAPLGATNRLDTKESLEERQHGTTPGDLGDLEFPKGQFEDYDLSNVPKGPNHPDTIARAQRAQEALDFAAGVKEESIFPTTHDNVKLPSEQALDKQATATPSTQEGRKPYATSIGNDNVKVGNSIAEEAMKSFGKLPDDVRGSSAGTITYHKIKHSIFQYQNALEEMKKLTGEAKKTKMDEARFFYKRLIEGQKEVAALHEKEALKAADEEADEAAGEEVAVRFVRWDIGL